MKQRVKVIVLLIVLAVIINVVFFSREYKKLQEQKLEKSLSQNAVEETINLLVIAPDYFNPLVSQNNYIQNIIIILGGLFIGQNAIESGTIGGTILFLTSISYIAVFAVTNNTYLITSINIFRFFILIMSYFLGILGFIISSFIVLLYLFKQNNNSNYYLYPIIPFNFKSYKAFINPKNKYKE